MKRLLIIYAVLLVSPCMTLAVDFHIPDSGQTKCFDAVGNEIIPCPSPSEDFYGQDGNYSINTQSYTKLDSHGNDLPESATEWVMVRDNVTGLIWEIKTDDGSIDDKDNTYTGYDAQNVFIETLNNNNFGGQSDWRMPTIKELATLVDSSILYSAPSINTDYFPNSVLARYWSSTTYAYPPGYADVVDFNDGSLYARDESYDSLYVRAVRGGQWGAFGNFIDNGDGTATDTDTGLMWQKDTAPDTYKWQQALSYCENLTLAGYDDWRLPNRNELQSIVDYSRYDPSINPIFPCYYSDSRYWSSTTYAYNPDDAWFVSFSKGLVYWKDKLFSYRNYVRAVRGGQCGSFGDSDGDTVCNNEDICPYDYNNDIDSDAICGDIDNCPNTPNPNQEDNYPPGGNSIGDACECEADFDCNGNVDAVDIIHFLWDFGRGTYYDPCTNARWCYGDFDCNRAVDADDVSKFLEDFGRSQYFNPCPACVVRDWCSY